MPGLGDCLKQGENTAILVSPAISILLKSGYLCPLREHLTSRNRFPTGGTSGTAYGFVQVRSVSLGKDYGDSTWAGNGCK